MKNYLLLATLLIIHPAFAETDQEKLEHCKTKFQQIAVDAAFEDLGCKFAPEAQKAINQNMIRTVAKCQNVLKPEERALFTKIGINRAQSLVKAHGLKAACDANGSLYPAQLNQ